MKPKELKEKSKEELKEMLASEREKIFEIKIKGSESRQKNVKEAREARKNIARILTILKS